MSRKLFRIITIIFLIFINIDVKASFPKSLESLINWAYCNDRACYTGPSTDHSIYKGALYDPGTLKKHVVEGSLWVIGRTPKGKDSISVVCTNHSLTTPVGNVDSCQLITSPGSTGYWDDAMQAGVATILEATMQSKSWGSLDGTSNGPKLYIESDPEEDNTVANRYYKAAKTITRFEYDLGMPIKLVSDNIDWQLLAKAKKMHNDIKNMKIAIGTVTYTSDADAFYLTIPITKTGAGTTTVSTSPSSTVQNNGTYKILKSDLRAGSNTITITADLSYKTYIAKNYSCGEYQTLTPMYIEPKTFTKTTSKKYNLTKTSKGDLKINMYIEGTTTHITNTNSQVTFYVYSGSNCSGEVIDYKTTSSGIALIEDLTAGSYSIKASSNPSGYEIIAPGYQSNSMCINSTYTISAGTETDANIYYERTCETKLSELGENPTVQELFDLYQQEKEKNRDYRGLLNIENPSCTTLDPPEKEIKNLTCLSGSTLSNANFTENNLSQYNDEIITDDYGSIKGFCFNSFYLKNNLGVQKFYAKSGQFLVKEIEEKYGDNIYKELQIYNSSYNPVRSCGNKVATATVTKTCYTLLDSLNYGDLENKIGDVKLYFGDNDLSEDADLLPLINDSSVVTSYEEGSTLKRYEFKREFVYGLNDVYLENITGKSTNSSPKVIKGITSKFNSTSGIIPFYINYYSIFQAGKDANDNYEELCTYETKQEIIGPPNKLNLEFRTIDTTSPFIRTPKSNWNDGSNEMSSNNELINDHIINATNSYGIKNGEKQSPLYRIELTSADILNIREYNKNTPYDNYKEECEVKDGNTVCTNTFLNNLANGQVVIYDKEGEITKTLTNKNKIELTNNNSNNTDVSTYEITEINGVDINTKICRKISSNNDGAIIIKNTNYRIGDKYICSVAPGVTYYFYIVGACGENKINMIMDRNLANSGINWVSRSDFDANKSASWNKTYEEIGNKVGPITALKKLDELTSAWTNIIPYNYTLIDEINDFKYDYINNYINDQHDATIDPDIQSYNPIEKNSVRARLLSRNEANNCGCATGSNNCPSFLTNGLSASNGLSIYYSQGYWLSNSACLSSTSCPSAYDIKKDQGAQSVVWWLKYKDYDLYYNGIRPVIMVYLSQISN